MDIEYFEKLWGSKASISEDVQKFWDLRADEFNKTIYRNEGGKRFEKVFKLLRLRGMLDESSEILDIGCGPGIYALEFAKRSKRVVGIDISPRMTAYARENAESSGLDNTFFQIADWDALNIDEQGFRGKFDLAFASMCPGINGRTALLKMCEASKRFCFISGFVQRKDFIRDKLYKYITGVEWENSWGKNIYCSLNILWLSGYYPEVTYYDTEWENNWPLEKAVEIYKHQLKLKDGIDADKEQQIVDFLKNTAHEGLVREKVQAKIAWMYWEV